MDSMGREYGRSGRMLSLAPLATLEARHVHSKIRQIPMPGAQACQGCQVGVGALGPRGFHCSMHRSIFHVFASELHPPSASSLKAPGLIDTDNRYGLYPGRYGGPCSIYDTAIRISYCTDHVQYVLKYATKITVCSRLPAKAQDCLIFPVAASSLFPARITAAVSYLGTYCLCR